jgi:glycosyltransferase involved in cell wall biosynthesis
MPEAPTFSVVIPAHNAVRTLPATIRSVLAQTRQDFEILVVDDGSIDGTEEALRRTSTDARIVFLRQENSGPAVARNAGIEASRGAFISLLDSDDLWLPTYLQAMAAALEAEPVAALAYTDAWRLDDEKRRIFRETIMATGNPPARPPRDPEALLLRLLRRNFVYTSATVRRLTLDEVGGFTNLTRSEDYELWLRIAANGRIFARAQGVLAVYRDRPGSRIHDRVAMLTGQREIFELVLGTYTLSPACRALAEARLQATRKELAELERRRLTAAPRPPSALRGVARNVRHFRMRTPREIARALPDLREI